MFKLWLLFICLIVVIGLVSQGLIGTFCLLASVSLSISFICFSDWLYNVLLNGLKKNELRLL